VERAPERVADYDAPAAEVGAKVWAKRVQHAHHAVLAAERHQVGAER